MSQQQPVQQSAHPGPLASIFIHLAGADPAVFHRLPPTEATTYVKLGITVLVPFFLAFTAGTFTVHSYLPENQKIMAVLAGSFWALFILFIDIAVMSQISPTPPPEPPPPQGPLYGPNSGRGAAPVAPAPKRKILLPLMRVMVAITVGLLTSHCMVLAMFDESLHKTINKELLPKRDKVQAEYSTRINPLDSALKEADDIKSTEDSIAFRAKYQVWLNKKPQADQPDTAEGATAKKSEVEEKPARRAKPSEMLLSQIESKTLKHETELARLNGEISGKTTILGDFDADLTQASRKLAMEKKSSTKQTYTFKHAFFKPLDGTTSGIPSDESAGKGILNQLESQIQDLIKRAPETRAAIETEITEKKAARTALIEAHTAEMQVLNPQLIKLQNEEAEQERLAAIERIAVEKALETANRTAINTEVERLTKDLSELRKRQDADLSEYDKAPDLATRTNALHQMILGDGEETTSMRLIVLVVMLTFALLDLMPVLLKLTKSFTMYDSFMLALSWQKITFFPEVNQPWNDRPAGAGGNHQRQQPTHTPGPRQPPPPPPR